MTTYSEMRAPEIYQRLLAFMKAMHWIHWTNHWQVRGIPYYGDHLLFERLYEAMQDEIDTLAEKLVAGYGEYIVDSQEQSALTAQMILWATDTEGDLYERALYIEQVLQGMLKEIFSLMEERDELSLGMNDYLAALANAHETNIYLLQQRLKSRMASSNVRVAARYMEAKKGDSWEERLALYDSKRAELDRMLKKFGDHLKKHRKDFIKDHERMSKRFGRDSSNWGFIGDIGHYIEVFKDYIWPDLYGR